MSNVFSPVLYSFLILYLCCFDPGFFRSISGYWLVKFCGHPQIHASKHQFEVKIRKSKTK